MTDEREDILLEAALDEVLGGCAPPDLSARIMQALAARQVAANQPSQNGNARTAADLLPPPIASEPVAPPPVSLTLPARQGSPARSRGLNWFVAAAALVAVAVGLPALYFAAKQLGGKPGEVVKVKPDDKKNGETKPAEALANNGNTKRPKPAEDSIANRPDKGFGEKLPFGKQDDNHPEEGPSIARAKVQPEPNAQIVAFANSVLKQAWEEKGVKPAPPATDAEWCRRVFLRVVGRIPTVEELKRFTANKSVEKKNELVDELLTADAYREEFSRHWAEFFASVLIGRSAGTDPEGPVSREGLVQYLKQSLLSGKSYDRLAFDLLTATGSGQPGSSDYNGAANFLLANLNEKGVLATSRTSRVFLGKQLQCAQCHNHPSNNWSQEQFWGLNAFFRQTAAQRDRETGQTKLISRDFHGETGDAAEADVFYEVPSGKMKVAYPAFSGTPSVSRSGLVSEVDRRKELAKRIAVSEDLARSAVNRLWGHFLGYGFTRPVDDMGPHNPPSHPALLDRLAQQFEAHDYNLPDLMRWIVLSEAFGVSSKTSTDNLADAPEAGEQPLFARYYTRQMQPEHVFESLQIAAAAQKNGGGAGELAKARLAWLGQFTREMGTDDGEEQNTFNGDIRQSLIMMHGPLMQRATSGEHGSILDRVAKSKLSFEEKVEHLFLAALSRKPTKRELDLALKIHADRKDAPSALQDIWWAVLNSNEFILDH